MPLGVVSDEDFAKEAKLITAQHKDIIRGRGHTSAVPEVIREIIAEEVIAGSDTQKVIAGAFGVSPSSVSAYAHGATSTSSYNEPKDKLQESNDKVRTNIIGTARARLLAALQNITPEKMAGAKLKDLASVAKDMSTVIHNTEPQVSNTNVGAQFIFHSPKSKQESDYNFIEVTK